MRTEFSILNGFGTKIFRRAGHHTRNESTQHDVLSQIIAMRKGIVVAFLSLGVGILRQRRTRLGIELVPVGIAQDTK